MDKHGKPSDKATRAKMFKQMYGNEQYTGSAEQNLKMLADLQKTSPKKDISSMVARAAKPYVPNAQRSSSGAVGAAGSKVLPDTDIHSVVRQALGIASGVNSNAAKSLLPNSVAPLTGQRIQNGAISQGSTKLRGEAQDIPEEVLSGLKASSGIAASAGNILKNSSSTDVIESGMLFDKATGKGYFVGNKKAGEQIDIVSGENPYNDVLDYTKYPSQYSERNTPTGKFVFPKDMRGIAPNGAGYDEGLIRALYPVEGMDLKSANVIFAMHRMANEKERNRLLGSSKPWASATCINCRPEDMKKILNRFPQGDTADVVNSFKPEGRRKLEAYGIKEQGGELKSFQPGGYFDKSGYHNKIPSSLMLDPLFQHQLIDENTVERPPADPRTSLGQQMGAMAGQGTTSLDENQNMKLKRMFGTPNIPAILATNLLGFGLATFANATEQGRQKAFIMKQMNDPAFNGSYSNAQNDYGVDPYEQTGQLRAFAQKGGKMQRGGKFNPVEYLYDGDDEKQEAKSVEKAKTKRITEEDVDTTDQDLAALGLSDNDIVGMDSVLRRRNRDTVDYNSTNTATYSGTDNNYALMYLKHQQGAAGIQAIKKAADQGLTSVPRNWSKENIQSNMSNNVGKDFKGQLTPASFLNYWSGKVDRHMKMVSKKQTPYDSIFQKVGQEEGIDPIFLKAVANIESGINPNNNTKSRYKGITALNHNTYGNKVFNPEFSLRTTAKNLKQFQEGGEYSVDFDTMRELQSKGIKFKIVD